LSDFQGLLAFGDVAANTRKMSFRYSLLCGMAFDAVDAVVRPRRIKIVNPVGFYIFKSQIGGIPYIVVVKKRSVIRTFFLQSLIPPFRISEFIIEKRCNYY